MWSHYTDSHKGICLKFDLLEDPNLFALPIKIKYKKDYSFYNHVKDSSKIIESLFQTKAECWSYENEFRVIKDSIGNHKFNKDALVEICFGARTNDNEIKRIKELAKKNNFTCTKFTKATVSTSTFEIQIKSLPQ